MTDDTTFADKRYKVSSDDVILDAKTGLEWFVGPDENTNHYEAKGWVKKLNINGGGWRLPTQAELQGIYQEGKTNRNMDPAFKATGWWVWATELVDNSLRALDFGFGNGVAGSSGRENNQNVRAFAVRSAK